jgi:D-alanyl-D-alanine carboxypeptidase
VPEALADLPLPPTPPMDMRPDLGQMAARLENTAPTGEPGGDWAAGLAPPIAGWGIQVGAFSDVATSRAAMDRATARLPGMLGDAVPQIAVLDEEGGRLFRARLVGLSEDTAAQACARLDSAGQPCMTVAPGE